MALMVENVKVMDLTPLVLPRTVYMWLPMLRHNSFHDGRTHPICIFGVILAAKCANLRQLFSSHVGYEKISHADYLNNVI